MTSILQKRENTKPNANSFINPDDDDDDSSEEMPNNVVKKTKIDEQVLDDIDKTVGHFLLEEEPLQITAKTKEEEVAIATLMDMEREKIYLSLVKPVSLMPSTKDGKTSLVSLASSYLSSAKDGRPSGMIASMNISSDKNRIIDQFKGRGYSLPIYVKPKTEHDANTIIVSNLFKGFEDKKKYSDSVNRYWFVFKAI